MKKMSQRVQSGVFARLQFFVRLVVQFFSVLLMGSFAASAVAQTKPCRLPGLANEVMCGSLKRPLQPIQNASANAGVGEGRSIEIHYVVFPSLARNVKAPPLFFLAGGPGQSAIELAGKLEGLFGRLNQRRDIVFVDQRGTGKSAPLLCPSNPLQTNVAQSLQTDTQIEQLLNCKKQWLALPYGDLSAFTTTNAMHDLEAVRVALGYGQIDLIGGSYGTRAALEFARLYPNQVRRMVIDGVAPPDMVLPLSGPQDAQAALQRVLELCTTSQQCQSNFPSLGQQWDELAKKLPITAEIKNPINQKKETLTLSMSDVLMILRQPLYSPSIAAGIPHAIGQAHAGNYGPLLGLASAVSSDGSAQMSWGMHFSVICNEDFPKMEASGSDAAKDDKMTGLYRKVCKDWPRSAIDPNFYDVKAGKAVVLILSGGADPVTPPRHGERIAKALGANAKHTIAPNLGHGVMMQGCAPDVMFRFFNAATNDAALKLDNRCIEAIPAPHFFVPFSSRVSTRVSAR